MLNHHYSWDAVSLSFAFWTFCTLLSIFQATYVSSSFHRWAPYFKMYLWTCEVSRSTHWAYSRSQNASVFSYISQRYFELRNSSSYTPQCVSISGLDPQYHLQSLLFSTNCRYLELSSSLNFLDHHRLDLTHHLVSWNQALILITSKSSASVYRYLSFLEISF